MNQKSVCLSLQEFNDKCLLFLCCPLRYKAYSILIIINYRRDKRYLVFAARDKRYNILYVSINKGDRVIGVECIVKAKMINTYILLLNLLEKVQIVTYLNNGDFLICLVLCCSFQTRIRH